MLYSLEFSLCLVLLEVHDWYMFTVGCRLLEPFARTARWGFKWQLFYLIKPNVTKYNLKANKQNFPQTLG